MDHFTRFNALLFPTILICLSSFSSFAQQTNIPVRDSKVEEKQEQKTESPPIHHKIDFGAGMGLDYGGLLGIQFGYSPVKHLLIFASGGYHLIEFGWELGVKGIYPSNTIDHTFRPYAKVMYGNNSVIYVEGLDEYNKTYKGVTTGLGAQVRFGKMKKNGIDFDLNILIRSQEYKDDYERLKNDPRVDVVSDAIPVSFSIGYHHEF